MAGLERLVGIFQRVELVGVVELLEEFESDGREGTNIRIDSAPDGVMQ